jgi:hypothetical protein
MKRFGLALCATAALFTFGAAKAESTVEVIKAEAAAAGVSELDPRLAERLAAEKEARKLCKTEICKVFAARKGEPGDISCDATKTWLDAQISKQVLSGRIDWPWGHATCTAHIDIDRAALAKLVADPEATIKLKPHSMKCLVDKKGGEGKEADSYVVTFTIAPEVTFKGGKATDVKLNWSNIEAPALLQGAIWSATTLDKAFDILGSSAASQINGFIYERCKDVGVEVAEKK